MRLAALDIGSNAIRYLVADVTAAGGIEEVEAGRFPVRLGRDVFATGSIGPAATAALTEAAGRFRERLEALGVEDHRAVATSALRESRNRVEVIERIRSETGIELQPIPGEAEARLVCEAVRRQAEPGGSNWLIADLGGGSLDVSTVRDGRIVSTVSVPVGAVRILEETTGASDPVGAARRYVAGRLGSADLRVGDGGAAVVVATGGNAIALADVAGASGDRNGVRSISVDRLQRAVDRLAALSPDQRRREFGLAADRADVIVPAGIVFERLLEIAGADRLVVPSVGLKEGVVHELAGRWFTGRRIGG